MSQFNRKGYTAVGYKGKDGSKQMAPIRTNSKIAHQTRYRLKKMKKQQDERVRDYKDRLREEKKKLPLSERSKINWNTQLFE